MRLAGALPIERNDEWLAGRRYLSFNSLAGLCAAWKTHAPRGPATKRRVAVLLPARWPHRRSSTTLCQRTWPLRRPGSAD
jgi:hypothetical protein